jgi:cation:H+ antiporter
MGNIIGANIIDLAIILPVCALIGGGTLAFNLQNMYLDLPVCLLIGAIALAPSLITQKISRIQGISLLTVYTAYIILMCVYFI